MIYLDNSATTYPKPDCVIKAVNNAFYKYGANAGRSGYDMAVETSEKLYDCRKKLGDFFGINSPERVIFTPGCTLAINMVIKGLAKNGSHFIISDLEHNAVVRPLETLKQNNIADYSIASVVPDNYRTLKNFEKCIKKNTVAIICTGASNVFGIVPPYRLLAKLAHKYNLIFILDASQSAGVLPINMQKDNIDILCCAGHKGLYGPMGTGFFILNGEFSLDTIIEGGTGSLSSSYLQPDELPDKFESGTPNVCGIIGLSSAIDFVNEKKIENIYKKETSLIQYLNYNLAEFKNIQLYTDFKKNDFTHIPIVAFNIKNLHSEEVAARLNEEKILVRAGLHCAPLAHKKFKTLDRGTVRISPSVFTQKKDIDFLINSVRKFAK